MLVSTLQVLAGLAALVAGGEFLVRGAVRIAERAGLSPAAVGLTVVSVGTSMPELVVSTKAALAGSTAIAVGNVVGSNIFNVGAILGIAALIAPLRIQGNSVRLEWPIMLLSAWMLHLLARDGVIDRLEGGFFVVSFIWFAVYMVGVAGRSLTDAESAQIEADVAPKAASGPLRGSLSLVAIGCALLAVGAHFLVLGGVAIAEAAGVSQTVIGLTIVAAGTSTPELVASVVASFRGRDDIAVANVIGSCIFNVLGILGVTALIHPLPIANAVLARDNWWMIGFAVALLPLMRSGYRISRVEGGLLATAFGVYLWRLLASA